MDARDGADQGDFLLSLPPRAQNLLTAAQRLLVDQGYEALTWSRIAREAGEQKSTIAYYFGDKATFVSALLRVLGQDAARRMVEQVEGSPQGRERVRAFLQAHTSGDRLPQSLAFFDVLPHAVRSPGMRQQVADLYTWYRDQDVKALGLESGPADRAEAEAIAWLFIAAVDGILIQRALFPDAEITECVYAKLEAAITGLVADLADRPDPAADPGHRHDGTDGPARPDTGPGVTGPG